jgi:hypothetical protein
MCKHLVGRLARLVLAPIALGAVACAGSPPSPPKAAGPTWRLERRLEIEGRQGIAGLDDGFVASGTTSLQRLDRDGRVVVRNDAPFEPWLPAGNHLGDIDVHAGRVYAPAERFSAGRGQDMHVALYDAASLTFQSAWPLDPRSGQREVAAVAVEASRARFWLADWSDGRFLYLYSLEDGSWLGRLALEPALTQVQGLALWGERLLVAADDGDSDIQQPDRVWVVDVDEAAAKGQARPLFDLREAVFAGEIEGLALSGQQVVVLHDRGRRIVDGVSHGFYPGYTREIRELHFFVPTAR